MDRPINPPTDPLDPYIEEAEQRWDGVFTTYEALGERVLPDLVRWLLAEDFSRRLLYDAITDQCDKLIQDLAERLYEKAKDNSKGYD
jgi:hypothetical protein